MVGVAQAGVGEGPSDSHATTGGAVAKRHVAAAEVGDVQIAKGWIDGRVGCWDGIDQHKRLLCVGQGGCDGRSRRQGKPPIPQERLVRQNRHVDGNLRHFAVLIVLMESGDGDGGHIVPTLGNGANGEHRAINDCLG